MSKLKVKDRVKRIKEVHGGMCVGDIGTVTRVGSSGVLLKEWGDREGYWHDDTNLERISPISKHRDLTIRIEAVTGWDKGTDDLLQEIGAFGFEINIPLESSGRSKNIDITKSVPLADGEIPTVAHFEYETQCEKLAAFKLALLWLLAHSDIKEVDNSEIKAEIAICREKLEELEDRL